MAVTFTAGDVVTPSLDSSGGTALARTALGPVVQPIRGINVGKVNTVPAPGGPVGVLWTGNLGGIPNEPPAAASEAIIAAGLDILGDPDGTLLATLRGRVAKVDSDISKESPEFQGTVVSLYVRFLGGDTAVPTATLALLKLNDGTFRELQADQLVVVSGR